MNLNNHKAAIYARVSTDEQNTDNQVALCREYCNRVGVDVFSVYADDGYSGAKASRPAFDELLRDMRALKFDAIVVVKMDRIGRSLHHLLSLFDELNKKKITFIAVTQNIDTSTAAGQLQIQIMGAFAEYERNIIRERTKEGLVGKVNVGKRGKDRKPRKKRGVSITPLRRV